MSMNFFSEVFSILFGGASPATITANMIMYLVGAAIVFVYDIRGRDVKSDRTPEKFNLIFFLSDNWHRLAMTLLIGLAVLIVNNKITDLAEVAGFKIPETLKILSPLFAGAFSDAIALMIKNNRFRKEAKPE